MIKYMKKIILLLECFERMEERKQLEGINRLRKIPGVKVLIEGVIEC